MSYVISVTDGCVAQVIKRWHFITFYILFQTAWPLSIYTILLLFAYTTTQCMAECAQLHSVKHHTVSSIAQTR